MHSACTVLARAFTWALALVAAAPEGRAAEASPRAACDAIRWDLDDTLRELVEVRLARGRALAPADVQLALRRRGLVVVDPVFRFDPRAATSGDVRDVRDVRDAEARDTGARDGDVTGAGPFACARTRGFPEGRATLRVDAPVATFDADPVRRSERGEREGLRVRVTFADDRDATAAVVVGGLTGAARTSPIAIRDGRGETVLAGAPAAGAVLQLVAMTDRGPEVVAERWLGDPEAIAGARLAADARAPRDLARGLAEERAALGAPPLVRSEALARLAERTLAAALARGLLVHRTEEGLVEGRLQHARIASRGAGELLARVPVGADAASRFAASPAHRSVLGDPALAHVGAAVQRGPDGLDWVVVVLAALAHEAPEKGHAETARPTRVRRPPRSAPRRP